MVYYRVCVFLVLITILLFGMPVNTHAYQLSQRSISVLDSKQNAVTEHTLKFTLRTVAPLGSIKIEYCDDPYFSHPCNPVSGVDLSSSNLISQAGETGFSILSKTQQEVILSRTLSPSSLIPVQYILNNVHNPSNKENVFVRVTTYSSIDATGSYTDFGAMVTSAAQGVGITTEVPPTLQFCVGVIIPSDCSSAAGYLLQLGELVPNKASTATSQMVGATNADFGYIITASGGSMASGTNEITPLSNPSPSLPGQSQFGINLRANSNPSVGADRAGTGIATPTADYNNPNVFKYKTGDIIARSSDETNEVKFTISYVVNVPRGQDPGIYSSTITYLCVATF